MNGDKSLMIFMFLIIGLLCWTLRLFGCLGGRFSIEKSKDYDLEHKVYTYNAGLRYWKNGDVIVTKHIWGTTKEQRDNWIDSMKTVCKNIK